MMRHSIVLFRNLAKNPNLKISFNCYSTSNDLPSTSSLTLTIKPIHEANVDFKNLMYNLKRSAKSRDTRRHKRKFDERILLEGRRLITDAILAGGKFSHIIVSDLKQLHDLPISDGEGQIYQISPDRMEAWSDLSTPPGIMGVFERPTCSSVLANRGAQPRLPVTVICDQIRDPSNMGAILRTAAAGMVDSVLVMDNCCDIYRTKILRSAMGAHFRVPIQAKTRWETVTDCLPDGFEMYLADNNSFELMSEAESYKMEPSELFEDSIDDAEPVDPDSTLSSGAVERSRLDRLEDLRAIKLPIVRYEHMDYSKDAHCVLVVGGESDGLSGGAHEVAHKAGAMRVHISMGNGIMCLNAATSVGIILFEIKRQLERAGRRVAADLPNLIGGTNDLIGSGLVEKGGNRRFAIGSREELVEHIAEECNANKSVGMKG